MGKCKAYTNNNIKCSRGCEKGKKLCWQHNQKGGNLTPITISNSSGNNLIKNLTIINWNIMDHSATQYSRLGNLETSLEYNRRYSIIIDYIKNILFKNGVGILCLEEVTQQFINILNSSLGKDIVSNYNVVTTNHINKRGGKFILSTLIHKSIQYTDLSPQYQKFYEQKSYKNSGYPSRSQVIKLKSGLILGHVHMVGLPGESGNTMRRNSLDLLLNFMQTHSTNHLRMIIGDFNEEHMTDVLKSVYHTKWKMTKFSDTRPTSFHRFIKHPNNIYEDKKIFGDLYKKVDHLLYDSSKIRVWPSVSIFPTKFTEIESPYQLKNNINNIEVRTINERPTAIIRDIKKIEIIPNIEKWPSDHALLAYKLRWK